MEGLDSGTISDDFAMFTQAAPEAVPFAKKQKEAADKMRKRDEAILMPKQLDAAAKLVEVTKKIDEKEVRASLLRKIHAYAKKYPEKLKSIALTPAKEAKASIEDLEHLVSDMEHELGKGASAKMLASFHVFALVQLENTSKVWNPLKLRLDNLGTIASANAETILEPLWEEFAIKHADWFSSKVETRLILATAQLIATTHRMNGAQAQQTIHKATSTPANAELLRKAAKLSAKK